MERYRVVEDLQGGEFGMGRDYDLLQWKKQALEWCSIDDNYEMAKEIYTLSPAKLIDYISEVWALKFRKVRKDKKHFNKNNLIAYEDETLEEFFENRFNYMEEKENETI